MFFLLCIETKIVALLTIICANKIIEMIVKFISKISLIMLSSYPSVSCGSERSQLSVLVFRAHVHMLRPNCYPFLSMKFI